MRHPLLAMAACLAFMMSASAQAQERSQSAWITLGTQGGPLPSPSHSQPANVLIHGADAYVVDAGEGVVLRLTQAGVRLDQVRAVLLSHLHFDHIVGVAAILGLRYAVNAPGLLAVYGPPGTKRFVDGLVASMQPAAEAGYGLPGEPSTPPAATVKGVEIADAAKVQLPGITVTATENSHYSFAPAARRPSATSRSPSDVGRRPEPGKIGQSRAGHHRVGDRARAPGSGAGDLERARPHFGASLLNPLNSSPGISKSEFRERHPMAEAALASLDVAAGPARAGGGASEFHAFGELAPKYSQPPCSGAALPAPEYRSNCKRCPRTAVTHASGLNNGTGASAHASLTTQRKPIWLVDVSIV